ncbi:MAG: FmdE family protein [Desulfobulbaceae bacterium]|nr:FmdE family protein [Desulfobulbaceae bacterium]
MDFAEVVQFHGHICPGLAMGFRVAVVAVRERASWRAGDEELLAIVENNSCAIDAIQMVTGCTAGKGNLVFRDYGKQVYTFIRRADGAALRLAICWTPPADDAQTADAFRRNSTGERSAAVMSVIANRKGEKAKAILAADECDLFSITRPTVPLPARAQVYNTVTCSVCGERAMEPKTARQDDGSCLCIPCQERQAS